MEKTKKIVCDVEGYGENFITVSTRWSKADRANFWNLEENNDDVWSKNVLHKKIVECHLERVDGDPLTKPADFNAVELRENLPEVLAEWMYWSIAELLQGLNSLGEAQRRRFFDTWVNPQTEPAAADTPIPEDVPAQPETVVNTNADKDQPLPPS